MSIDAIGSAFRFSKTYRGKTEKEGQRAKGKGLRTKDRRGRTKTQGVLDQVGMTKNQGGRTKPK